MPHFPKPFYRPSRKLWYVQLNGRQICLGPDEKLAFQQYHQLMQAPPLKPQPTLNPAFVVLADAYLEWTKRERAPETFEWYRHRLQRFCERYPDLNIRDLKPLHVQDWPGDYPKLSRTSRRNYIRSVKTCLNWALAQGYIDKNPIAQMPVPGADHREVTLSQDEYQQLLQAIPDPAFKDLVIVTWETGCRPQESLRVEARHVDLPRKRWVFPKSEAKGKRQPRIVYLTESASSRSCRPLQHPESGSLDPVSSRHVPRFFAGWY